MINLGASVCKAQTNNSQKVTNWGESVQGVRMSITMTNKVVKTDSTISLEAVIKDYSTNAIAIEEIFMPGDFFNVALISDTGEKYDLIKPPIQVRAVTFKTINPGEQCVWSLPVTFGRNIKPGDYTLQATRWFWVKSTTNEFKLESNSLKVQIK